MAECTGLPLDDSGATDVVDRAAWARANVEMARVFLSPLNDRVPTGGLGVGSRITALELGGALAWLSTKVLGQFEALVAPGRPQRLLLVAPNIVATERALEVESRDFRMWVCLHEETHRLQFRAAPWLEDYITAEIRTLTAATDEGGGETLRRVAAGISRLARSVAARPFPGITELVEAFQTPAQRESFERLTALMTLLEGHADVVMDLVGPEVVPTVATIRERFEARRSSPGASDGLARRLIGMDAKLRQYSEGARFVRAVLDAEGMESLNRVWVDAAWLPTRDEVLHPRRWLRRMSA